MFSVGHLALGYLSGRASSKFLKVNLNIPLLFLVSVLPDLDLLIPGIEHRGPTHSIIFLCILSLPALMIYKKRVVPYFTALAQHSLIGDYLTGDGVKMLWPAASNWYGAGIKMTSLTNISLEWIFFLICLTIMFKTRDAWTLTQHHPSNLLLSVPFLTILLPFFKFPMPIPLELIIPHIAYLTLFTVSLLIDLKFSLKTI